jgi:hypothetical protein
MPRFTVRASILSIALPAERRRVGRYHNRALQITPPRAARRHAAPGRRVPVRETQAGDVRTRRSNQPDTGVPAPRLTREPDALHSQPG